MSVDASSTQTERAYHALQDGAVVTNRSDRLRMLFTGEKAAESLTGLVTNDVSALAVGRGQYAAALTNKGKILADVRIFATEGGLLVDANAAAGAQWAAMVKKFVNPRLAKYQDISQQSGDVGVFGPNALEVVRAVFSGNEIPGDLGTYGHMIVRFADTSMMLARVPDFGVDGYDIIGPRELMDELYANFVKAGAIEEANEALQIARIAAGRPEWGIDMDDSMLAQEMDMDRLEAISYTKGCYTGQETVARVHYRGHVNRLLRGLRLSDAVVPPAGTPLTDADDKEIGTVKSGALAPRGGAIALATLRREVEPGSTVRAKWSGQSAEARVESLPMVLDG
jgi:tRNA-modifying protein YgfZ